MVEPEPKPKNFLYYGDNLDVLRRHVKDGSVDLVYLDPPFSSNANYNLLFEEHGEKSTAQVQAFTDTWEWNTEARSTYEEIVESGGHVADAMRSFHTLLGASDMLAYLSMMAPRIVELRRVLRGSGSLYLHCDPTASGYLRVVLDAIFGPRNFRNEIIWQRTISKGLMTRRLPNNHDVLLAYQKGSESYWDDAAVFQAYDADSLDARTSGKYSHRESDGRRYRLDNLTQSQSRSAQSRIRVSRGDPSLEMDTRAHGGGV